ncbi:MAG TPA: hypothetical protein VF762_08220 [Blastocatellia bacterium]
MLNLIYKTQAKEIDGGIEMGLRQEKPDVDMVELFEQMLFQRAARGIRPVLYVSSYTDLECSMLMLLDEENQGRSSGQQQPIPKGVGYHITTN